MKLRFFYLLFPLILSSCVQLPDSELQQNSSWEAQQTQLENLTHWSLSGKLGIFTPGERNSVDIYWQQSDQDFHIRLSAMLGVRSLDIKKQGKQTTIINTDGQHHQSNNTEQLITELSGMVLPVNNLQQWIKGNPSGASFQLDDNQQVVSLLGGEPDQGVWEISYADYRTINGTNLPHKLQLTRGDIRLKFAISKWNIPPLQ